MLSAIGHRFISFFGDRSQRRWRKSVIRWSRNTDHFRFSTKSVDMLEKMLEGLIPVIFEYGTSVSVSITTPDHIKQLEPFRGTFDSSSDGTLWVVNIREYSDDQGIEGFARVHVGTAFDTSLIVSHAIGPIRENDSDWKRQQIEWTKSGYAKHGVKTDEDMLGYIVHDTYSRLPGLLIGINRRHDLE